MKPISDRIFIKLNQQNSNSSNGIILPKFGIDKQRANVGQVVAVGDYVHSVAPGDEVMFHPFDELETPTKDLVGMRE